jgi:hypothetical protein
MSTGTTGPSAPRDPVSASETVRARAFDVAALLGTVGLVIALAQLPAWRAAFSTAAAVTFAAAVFAFRYLRGRWRVVVCAALVFLAVAALVTVYLQPVLAKKPSPGPSFTPSPAESSLLVAVDALQPGDCVSGSDLHLDDSTVPWPKSALVVPCEEPHDGEVFLAADLWAANAAFPGDDAVDDLAKKRCREAFQMYVGVDYLKSILEYTPGSPSDNSWESGDRHVFCIAYDPKAKLKGTVRRLHR